MRKTLYYLVFITIIIFGVESCKKDIEPIIEEQAITPILNNKNSSQKKLQQLFEDFENASKSNYSTATLTLSSGTWLFNDALIGATKFDKKIGNKCLRVQNNGSLTLTSLYSKGASLISITHAKYNTESSSTWNIQYSIDNGLSWVILKSFTTNSAVLITEKIGLNIYGNIQIKIQKTGGGRLNIDNILVEENNPTPSRDENLLLGNPSNATSSLVMANNYLMLKNEYVLSYNNSKGHANWVSWHLSKAWKGGAARATKFIEDVTLPIKFFSPKTSHYTGTGFDRGHICPSDDRDADAIENQATFYMTNIFPQAPINNQQIWRKLELYCQQKALDVIQGYEMYIYSGTIGSGGVGSNGYQTNINYGAINVPEKIWKVIVMLPNGSNDLYRISANTRVISVIIPNNQVVGPLNWGSFRVSVDDIEAQTGLDILNELPTSLQSSLESVVDSGPTI